MLPMNGNSQLPKRSIRYPDNTGQMIAASAEPVFIMPLAVPEYSGAISIGIAHIGPIVISAKKKPALRLSTEIVRSWVNRIGNSDSRVNSMHTATI